MLTGTPFHPRTAPLVEGQAWRRWAGYTVASSYELTHDREYWSIRNSAALIDVSPLYKYRVSGPHACRLLDRIVTRDVARAPLGQVLYTPWCDSHGKVIDDGTLARLGEQEFRLTAAEPNLRWLHLNSVGMDVSIEDLSERQAALSVQGPLARDILAEAADADVRGLRYFRAVPGRIRGIPVHISRTGYTGDLGYEIFVEAGQAVPLWDALVAVGTPRGLTPCGIWGLDIARIEAGLLMLDVDYTSTHRALIEAQKSSPFELNLGWAVAATKAAYNGQAAHQAERQRGAEWQFVGIDVIWESLEREYAAVGLPPRLPTVAWRQSTPIYVRGRQVGYATSGCWSPLLKKYLALAHLDADWARPGTSVGMEVTVEHRRRHADAVVTPLPFFNPDRKRA